MAHKKRRSSIPAALIRLPPTQPDRTEYNSLKVLPQDEAFKNDISLKISLMHQKVTCRPCFRIPLGPNNSNCPNLPWPRDEWQVHRSTQLFKTYLESYYYPFLSRATSHHLDDTISSLEKQHSVNHNFCPRVYFFTNVVNHVSTNFERRTIDYIFIQFTNWTTGFWKRFHCQSSNICQMCVL